MGLLETVQLVVDRGVIDWNEEEKGDPRGGERFMREEKERKDDGPEPTPSDSTQPRRLGGGGPYIKASDLVMTSVIIPSTSLTQTMTIVV